MCSHSSSKGNKSNDEADVSLIFRTPLKTRFDLRRARRRKGFSPYETCRPHRDRSHRSRTPRAYILIAEVVKALKEAHGAKGVRGSVPRG